MLKLAVFLVLCAQALSIPITQEIYDNAWEHSGYFEGDIRFPNGRNGLIDPARKWPGNTLIYQFDASVNAEQRAFIQTAIDDYNTNTCARIQARTNEANYVNIMTSDSGCYSYIGRIGGAQDLNYQTSTPGNGCFRYGTIIHELLHAFGFYHQQSATDRDDWVTIHFENIQAGTENNFNKYPASVITDYGVPYDYASVMHYGATAFSSNGLPTIVPTDPNAEIGQRVGFSPSDILKLNAMYPCANLKKE